MDSGTLAVALVAVLASGTFLERTRRRGGSEETRGPRRIAAQVAAWLFAVSLSGTLLHGTLFFAGMLGGSLVRGPEPSVPVVGALLGLMGYLHVRLLVLETARWSFFRAVRAPERLDRTWRMEARSIAWGVCAWPCIGALVMSVVLLYRALPFLVIPVVVAIPLFYETWLHPWLQYWKSRRLGNTRHHELEDWLCELADRHAIPRFHVRVHDGLEKNAFAMGGLLRNLVVVGGGLAERMTTRQLQAILAHEIAHVIRRDVLKLAAATLAGGTCFLLAHVEFISPSIDGSTTLGVLLRAGLLGTAFCLCYVVAPGLVSRRIEYGADRLAVRLLGDGAPLIDALVRLHELRNVPLDKKSLTHPTGARRIAAIQALSPGIARSGSR